MPAPIALIPRPTSLVELDGDPFVLTPATVVVVGETPQEIAVGVLTADILGRIAGCAVEIRYEDAGAAGVVSLRIEEGWHHEAEAYSLTVGRDRLEIISPSAAGLVRALVTVRQLAQEHPGGAVAVPAVHVQDVPRYAWRGLSVDVARHFFDVEQMKVVIALMAHYKLNVLHLHLTDDQGWRLDLPSRPLLAARSSSTSVGGGPGGCYTAEDYQELVAFAAVRGVSVVPEIDVPGHVNAALHAYGELTPSGEAVPAYSGIEVGFSRLHVDLPTTGPFLRDVFGDVARLTPGDYVHIGGDEVLTMAAPEYAALVGAAAEAVRAAGKQVVGWQEIAHTPLEPGTVVQYWDTRVDPEPFIAAAQAGARLLMSPGSKAYLDMKYDASTERGLEWAGHIELRDAYDWDPDTLIPGLPAGAVIGVEAAVWTETLSTLDDLTTMLLPRLAAIAEVAWSAPEQHDWADFRARIASHGAFWERVGFDWYPSPQVDWVRPED
ncbi:family 20 glycosylhydrolase [Cellulomonas hominis]